ncbi:MAG: hydantoinase B/oxoprolinase family protein [Actinobacteria bacterium]|nr:hydantoinase B/oxoprolinase family protein [Actinomycetota bacterium]
MSSPLDPIAIQVIESSLRSICEEMGASLIRAAYSTNIKERRDCSTALFDANGRMVAQAEHIPVHLGAMPDAVRAVMAEDPLPGDIFILNDPFRGGTHLPDITVVSAISVPVEVSGAVAPGDDNRPTEVTPGGSQKIIAYAASRAHHADVGGAEPGSMPAASTTLAEEGVVIPPSRLVSAGEPQDGFLKELLSQMRRPGERLGDLRAQMGAGRIAERRLLELVERQGLAEVTAAMDAAVSYAERRMRRAISGLPEGVYRAEDYLERDGDDLTIAVTVTIEDEELHIDFEGTSPQESGNLNCPMPVTRSACYYVLRAVTDPDIPANAGALAPVHISAPEGLLVNARPPAAVAAGNVETSQRIVDTLLLALSKAMPLPAQGQGTMNNLTLGSEEPGGEYNYYETIGGGAGACPGVDGASGIHQGMTNTLNTPVEALEMAFPLRIESYEFRKGSGGNGVWRGGEGVVRSMRLLAPARLSLLADRRRHAPRGAGGGAAGLPGKNLINGEEVAGKLTVSLETGDVVTVATPGGGGYGSR